MTNTKRPIPPKPAYLVDQTPLGWAIAYTVLMAILVGLLIYAVFFAGLKTC